MRVGEVGRSWPVHVLAQTQEAAKVQRLHEVHSLHQLARVHDAMFRT